MRENRKDFKKKQTMGGKHEKNQNKLKRKKKTLKSRIMRGNVKTMKKRKWMNSSFNTG